MQNFIRLDDLLGRDVVVQWFEGVAVVEAACRQLCAERSWNGGFPPASNILIGPDGEVAIIGTVPGGNPVTGAAHLLAAMLGDDVPVRLRLIVTEATGEGEAFPSLAEFTEALAYFERPNPDQIIRELHARAVTAGPRTEPRLPMTVPVSPVVREPEPAEPWERQAASGVSGGALLAVAVAAVFSAAVWLVGMHPEVPQESTSVEAVEAEVEAPAAPEARGAETPKSTAGNAARIAAGSARGPAIGRAAETPAPPSLVRRQAARPVPMLTLAERPVAPSPPAEPLITDVETIVLVAAARRNGQGEEMNGGRLYSAADEGVRPPRQVYPKLPTDSVAARDEEGRTMLELVVATDGLVERVKLLTPPRDIHEFMLVPAAKAWRFEAATLDGRPVRFLHRIPITTQ